MQDASSDPILAYNTSVKAKVNNTVTSGNNGTISADEAVAVATLSIFISCLKLARLSSVNVVDEQHVCLF